ncbi:unnamed protein product [Cyclocybe aegerita]|uniref:F-box domain-containing protein n=1 Tax=Cyclocybe aegerita TaxID=1973307 RepID=A0A8S0WQ88_CYCAE|nr:unnamed protein product [Cyclocybe aegerita]
MYFEHLPAELYEAIFRQVPSRESQRTVLAVSRAIPSAPVPLYYLFRNLCISVPDQAIRFYSRFRRRTTTQDDSQDTTATLSEPEQKAAWVKELYVETWEMDADVFLNLVRLFPRLRVMSIRIGPTNFAPEHLEDLFSKPFPGIRYVNLRFRPYVQKATYYQFLKGAYFDSTLLAISRWPSSHLPTISIVQDALEPEVIQKHAFAQPLVFHRLDYTLSIFLHSHGVSRSLKALRFRIPGRPIARSLCSPVPTPPNSDFNLSKAPASLEFLDVSTCGVLESEVDTILVRFTALKHLILDGCAILRGELLDGEWNALGKRCALVGARRAKEREKALKAWAEVVKLSAASVSATTGSDAPAERRTATKNLKKAKRGRKGLAAATISLRNQDYSDRPAAASSRVQSEGQRTEEKNKPPSKIRIFPSLPTLKTICVTVSPAIKPDKYSMIRAEFESGWAEGVALLSVTRARQRASARNGFRIMRIVASDETDEEDYEPSLKGLEDVGMDDEEVFAMKLEDGSEVLEMTAPVICFCGSEREEFHEPNCGHRIGRKLMGDDL